MPKLLIIEANFYPELSGELVAGATEALQDVGAEWDHVTVPGALEIPAVIRFAAETDQYDGYVALGCVMRGETYHFDVVCNESARGISWLTLTHGLCIGNGILTVEDEEQAWARALRDQGNKGAGAAEAALSLIALRERFGA